MTFTITVQPSGRTFSANPDEAMLATGIRQGIGLPYGCKDGACGSCKCKLLAGNVVHGPHQSKALSAEEEARIKQPILEQYERQAHAYYSSARLWDDGVIDPAQTREVLGLALSASLNAPIEATRFGVFRM